MKKLSPYDITLIAFMVAVIEVCKITLAHIPNVELTSFWLIIFTVHFKKKVLYVIPAFILIEGLIFGFGLWWIMYLYAWPVLCIVTYIFRKGDRLTMSIISCIFGLMFGMLCSIPYIFTSGLSGAFAYWIAGIPFDLIHGIANFVLMFILYKPITKVLLQNK